MILVLRFRRVDAEELPEHRVRAVRGRCRMPLPDAGTGGGVEGGLGGAVRGMRAGVERGEDEGCALQGQQPEARASRDEVHVPGVRFPAPEGKEPRGTALRELQSGRQRQGGQSDPPGDSGRGCKTSSTGRWPNWRGSGTPRFPAGSPTTAPTTSRRCGGTCGRLTASSRCNRSDEPWSGQASGGARAPVGAPVRPWDSRTNATGNAASRPRCPEAVNHHRCR